MCDGEPHRPGNSKPPPPSPSGTPPPGKKSGKNDKKKNKKKKRQEKADSSNPINQPGNAGGPIDPHDPLDLNKMTLDQMPMLSKLTLQRIRQLSTDNEPRFTEIRALVAKHGKENPIPTVLTDHPDYAQFNIQDDIAKTGNIHLGALNVIRTRIANFTRFLNAPADKYASDKKQTAKRELLEGISEFNSKVRNDQPFKALQPFVKTLKQFSNT
jgi:hypothetical protein